MSDELNAPEFNAPEPEPSLEAPELSGTVRLAASALSSPAAPAQAEAESLRQVETLMQDAALSPRVLREAAGLPGSRSLWDRLRFWKK
jgi:hypothetical protein